MCFDQDQSSVIWLEIKAVAPLINKAGGEDHWSDSTTRPLID